MTGPEPGLPDDPLVIAVRVADARLVERATAVLAVLPGLRLAAADEPADLLLIAPCQAEAADGDATLTTREAEVLALLAEGASNKVIARRLGISVHTAKFHVGQLLDKLDAPGRRRRPCCAAGRDPSLREPVAGRLHKGDRRHALHLGRGAP